MKHLEHKVYPYLINPEKYPAFFKRYAKAVTRNELDNMIQFTSLRALPLNDENKLEKIKEIVELYVDKFALGNIIWPVYTNFLAKNFSDLVDIANEKKLFIFDIWGYVPGSKPSKNVMWGEYELCKENLEYLKQKMGSRFIGFDNGEQDGRYIGSFSKQYIPISVDRKIQYESFQNYFEKMGDAFENNLTTLASLTFLHYFAKEGNTVILGAENAQALLNTNMWFSFIRGASAQYGLIYFGNASVWNRWGFKSYESQGKGQGYEWGPECGTSLSLLRRILYSHYMYNCDILGFESGWIEGDNTEKRLNNKPVKMDKDKSSKILSPVGKIQAEAVKFSKKYPSPGTMVKRMAFIMDFFCGWVPPRHLYTGDIYKVWGNLPYKRPDYQADLFFSLLYPGYENSGFFRDERGFLSSTPYGDITDVLYSDVQIEILNRYQMLVLSSGIEPSLELSEKLIEYVRSGGKVIVFGDLLDSLWEKIKKNHSPEDFFGMRDTGKKKIYDKTVIYYEGKEYKEENIGIRHTDILENTEICSFSESTTPIIIKNTFGEGLVYQILTGDGLKESCKKEISYNNKEEKELNRPFRFYEFIEDFLSNVFDELSIIRPDNRNLQYILCTKSIGEYSLMVSNNSYQEQGFDIISSIGKIVGITEIPILDNIKECKGYLPPNVELKKEKEKKKNYYIEGGDLKIFSIKLENNNIGYLSESNPQETEMPAVFINMISKFKSIKQMILCYPDFENNYSGVFINARYFLNADKSFCYSESQFLKRRKIKIIIDFTPLLNQYADFTLLQNLPKHYETSMDRITDIIKKAALYDTSGIIFTLHKNAECNISEKDALKQFYAGMEKVYTIAKSFRINVVFQNGKNIGEFCEIAAELKCRCPKILFASNISNAISDGISIKEYNKEHSPSGYIISSPLKDRFGQTYKTALAIKGSKYENFILDIIKHKSFSSAKWIVLAADYNNRDEIYEDYLLIRKNQ